MKEWIKESFLADWTPWEKGLLMADVLLLGILIGWLTSPFKARHSFLGSDSRTIWEKEEEEREQEEEEK